MATTQQEVQRPGGGLWRVRGGGGIITGPVEQEQTRPTKKLIPCTKITGPRLRSLFNHGQETFV